MERRHHWSHSWTLLGKETATTLVSKTHWGLTIVLSLGKFSLKQEVSLGNIIEAKWRETGLQALLMTVCQHLRRLWIRYLTIGIRSSLCCLGSVVLINELWVLIFTIKLQRMYSLEWINEAVFSVSHLVFIYVFNHHSQVAVMQATVLKFLLDVSCCCSFLVLSLLLLFILLFVSFLFFFIQLFFLRNIFFMFFPVWATTYL